MGGATLLWLQEGDEIEASEVFVAEGVEWAKLDGVATGTEVSLDLKEIGYVQMQDPELGMLLKKNSQANANMSSLNITPAMARAVDWITNADAVIIGSSAGMGLDTVLGDLNGSDKEVWKGLEAVGLEYKDMCHHKWFQEDAHRGWAFWNSCHRVCHTSKPPTGYTTVRQWAERSPLGFFSFTSDFDGNWTASGNPAERIVEVNGAVKWLQCSTPCCWDVWQAPEDLGLSEDEATHRVRGKLPLCPKCQAVARPNVQLLGGDKGFSKVRRQVQFRRYISWLKQLEDRPDKDSLRITCIEVCGGAQVPTVQNALDSVLRNFPQACVIRMHPENHGLDRGPMGRSVSLTMSPGLAIKELDKVLSVAGEKCAYILWGSNGAHELQAPRGVCIGHLLRLAQAEDVKVEFSSSTRAVPWTPPHAPSGKAIELDQAVPDQYLMEVRGAADRPLQPTCMLTLPVKFVHRSSDTNLNRLLQRRVDMVCAMLDELSDNFVETSSTDALGLYGAFKKAALKLLPGYGFDANDAGFARMLLAFRIISSHPKVAAKMHKLHRSAELSPLNENKARRANGDVQEAGTEDDASMMFWTNLGQAHGAKVSQEADCETGEEWVEVRQEATRRSEKGEADPAGLEAGSEDLLWSKLDEISRHRAATESKRQLEDVAKAGRARQQSHREEQANRLLAAGPDMRVLSRAPVLVTLIIWSTEAEPGGCEIRLPFGVSVLEALRRAETEAGFWIDYSYDDVSLTKRINRIKVSKIKFPSCRILSGKYKDHWLQLDAAIPVDLLSPMPDDTLAETQPTVVLQMEAAFKQNGKRGSMNNALKKRVTKVCKVLNDIKVTALKQTFQLELIAAADRHLEFSSIIQQTLLSRHLIDDSEEGFKLLSQGIAMIQCLSVVKAKVAKLSELLGLSCPFPVEEEDGDPGVDGTPQTANGPRREQPLRTASENQALPGEVKQDGEQLSNNEASMDHVFADLERELSRQMCSPELTVGVLAALANAANQVGVRPEERPVA